MKKRLIAFLLVLIMVLGMLPVSAMAAGSVVTARGSAENPIRIYEHSGNQAETSNGSVQVPVGETVTDSGVLTFSTYSAIEGVQVSKGGVYCAVTSSNENVVKATGSWSGGVLTINFLGVGNGTAKITVDYTCTCSKNAVANGLLIYNVTVGDGGSTDPSGKPNAPTASDIGAFPDAGKAVLLHCVDAGARGHDATASSLNKVQNGYSVGEVVENPGTYYNVDGGKITKEQFPWMCVVTVHAAPFIELYNSNFSERYGVHKLAGTSNATATLHWFWHNTYGWQYLENPPIQFNITRDTSEKTYTLNYYKNTTDTVTNMPVPNPQTEKSNTGMVTFTVSNARPSRDGYTFLVWAGNPDATTATVQPGNTVTTPRETTNLYAVRQSNTPPIDRPDKPKESDVTGVVVDIVCVTTTGTHDTAQYPLGHPTDAQHTIGEVVSDGAGGYICPVTVRTAWFVQQASNLVWNVQHTPTAQTITFNLTYDKNSKTWVKPAANPRIEATHEVTPEIPGDQKPNIEEANAKIRVQCIEYPSKHNPYTKNYRILPGSYEDLGWDRTEYGYIYSIRLNRAKYIAQFDQEIGRPHTDTEPNKETRINWRWENGAWHLIDGPDGVTADIKVKCAEIKEPTREDIFKALNGLVTVTCINRFWKDGNNNMDCGQGQYAAKAGIVGQEYTLVKGEDDTTWVVTFPVTNFVKSFKQDPAHNLYTKDTLRWYIRWEDNTWTSAPVEPGVDDLVKLTHAPTDWREVAKIATGGKSDCIHVSCVNGETGVCDYGITVPFVYSATDVVSVEPEDGVPGSYIATFKVDRYIDTCAKACNDKNFPDAPRTHKLLTQETVQWRLYATSEADEKIGNNVLNHVWAADPVTPGTDDVCTIAHNWVVTFDPNGGTPVPLAQEVEYGHTATKPVEPTLKGYTFDGWYLGDEKYDFSAAVEQNITLTAKWEKKTYKVVAKLYVNGKPAYYQNTDFYTYEVSGLYGEAIDFDTIKAKAVEQAKQIKKASASYTAVILEDHEPNAVCATYGEHQPNQATHYVKVNVKTEEKVVILQSFAGKTDLTKLHTTTAPYGTNVVEFLNGLGLDLDVAGYTLDTDEDGNTNWYKKDSPKWTFGANDTINGWTNVLLKYTITPHNIYAYLRTGDSIGDVLELNEATLNRLGLTKYNTEGFISIGTFVSNTLLTQDEYYGFDEDEAFLDVLAELQTKLVPETGVSLDKVGSKINWSWLYQPSDVDDRIAGYPTEDTDGYQLSGSLLLYGAKFEAGANDVTGMPTAAYGAYLDYFVSGESFNLPAAPTRPGYDFKGWKIGNAVLTAGAAYTVDEDDMVFTAQWEARTDTPYTVEHYLEKLDGSYALDTTEPLKGTTDTTVTAAAKSYDNFTYDSTVPDTVASGNIAGDGSLVLKLFYTRNTYDYTVRHIKQLPDGSYDEANAEVETLSGKFEALAAVTAKDYGSHYPTNDADTKQNIKIEKGLTIDVKYDLDEHTLTFETNGGSAINPVTVRHGNAVARPADPTKDKYTFIGWYADPEFTEEYDFATVLEADKTIYAKFELTSTPIGDIYVRYDVLHIKQLPDGTYDLANAEVEHLSAKKDTTVTAVIKDYRATHHVNVNRTLSKLTGTAIQPYRGVDGKPVYTILSVYYDLDFHTLTFDTMGGSKIAPETVRHGLTVAKPKDPVNGGYIFDGWYTDKTFRHRYDFSTPLTEDITIYAKWFLIVLPGVTVKKNTPKLNTADHFAYVQGYPDGTVKPAGNITRAETAAILFRLMDDASRKTYYSTKSGFRDVASGSWYNTYVATLNNAGVITDSSNGCFRPNEAITRAELAAMLAKFSETTGAANYFNDVSAKYWAANAIAICAKLGWINGYPDGTFRPDKNVTRAELMAMINRATGRAPKSADAFLPGMKTWSDNTADKWYYLDVQEATNSHSYTVKGSETWTALTSDPNWSLYE